MIEGTFWNSFQNLTQESASTYTDKDIAQLDELSLFVLLPENKVLKGYSLWSQKTGSAAKSEFRGDNRLYADRVGRFLYWNTGERKPDHHYELTWTW